MSSDDTTSPLPQVTSTGLMFQWKNIFKLLGLAMSFIAPLAVSGAMFYLHSTYAAKTELTTLVARVDTVQNIQVGVRAELKEAQLGIRAVERENYEHRDLRKDLDSLDAEVEVMKASAAANHDVLITIAADLKNVVSTVNRLEKHQDKLDDLARSRNATDVSH